jgi:4-aminobutyrate aminotransferase-like enzyme
MKLARQVTGKQNIIYFQGATRAPVSMRCRATVNARADALSPVAALTCTARADVTGSFHGRTIGTLSVTSSKNVYAVGFGPLMAGVQRAPFPYCLRCKCSGGSNEQMDPSFVCCGDPIEQLNLLLKQVSPARDTAAVIVELGEGGYVVPPKAFFKQLRKFCDDNGILLIADEVSGEPPLASPRLSSFIVTDVACALLPISAPPLALPIPAPLLALPVPCGCADSKRLRSHGRVVRREPLRRDA